MHDSMYHALVEENKTEDNGGSAFPLLRRTALQTSLTGLGAIGFSGLAARSAGQNETETGTPTSEPGTDTPATETETEEEDDPAVCADGVELPATELTLPEDVTPVSELNPQPFLPPVLGVGGDEHVDSPETWREQRRPRLKGLFRQYIYGYAPPAPRRTFDVELESNPVFDGAATLKRVTIRFPELPDEAPTIRLDVFVPTETEGQSPVIFGLNSFGNHVVADVPSLAYPLPVRQSGDTDGLFADRGGLTDYWQVSETIDRGYAFATASISDFHSSSFGMGPMNYLWQHRGESPGALRNGALAAWAWGISRCVDYLIEDCEIRDDGIAAFGHSRAGKATLLAGATDERISLTIPHQSGTAGVALNRHEPTRSSGETVEDIAITFPDWFSEYYPMFATAVDRFPMDQHHLVGLVAPRAILATESAPRSDYWTNPDASLLSIQLASKVWELLEDISISRRDVYQQGGSIPDNAPPVMHYRRDVGHTMTLEYWEAIYEFADQHL